MAHSVTTRLGWRGQIGLAVISVLTEKPGHAVMHGMARKAKTTKAVKRTPKAKSKAKGPTKAQVRREKMAAAKAEKMAAKKERAALKKAAKAAAAKERKKMAKAARAATRSVSKSISKRIMGMGKKFI